MTEIPFDASDQLEPQRLTAAQEIAEAERAWSAARSLTERRPNTNESPEQHMARIAVQQVFYELTELQQVPTDALPALLGIFASDSDLLNLTLGRLEMGGSWHETYTFERDLFGQLYDVDYKNIQWIRRDERRAKVSITIPAGFTSEMGFVALQRKRRLIIAEHINKKQALRPVIEVDKISTFALDIQALQQIDDEAAAEVRLIVATTMYRALDIAALSRFYEELQHGEGSNFTAIKYLFGAESAGVTGSLLHAADFNDYFKTNPQHRAAVLEAQAFDAAIRRNNISLADIQKRLDLQEPIKLHNPQGIAFIENAISEQDALLTPAITTYYAH